MRLVTTRPEVVKAVSEGPNNLFNVNSFKYSVIQRIGKPLSLRRLNDYTKVDGMVLYAMITLNLGGKAMSSQLANMVFSQAREFIRLLKDSKYLERVNVENVAVNQEEIPKGMRISNHGRIDSYVKDALDSLQEREIMLQGCGKGISRAVEVAEKVKRSAGIYSETSIKTASLTSHGYCTSKISIGLKKYEMT